MPDQESNILPTLAANGPWAVMAGLLLYQVMKAWTADRQQVTELLGGFRSSIEKLASTLDHIADEIKDLKTNR
jgi:hypothetical protein